MSEFFDYNPTNGVTQKIEWDNDVFRIHHSQDVEPILKYAKAQRDNCARKGTVEEWAHYAILPNTFMMDMFKKGINPLKKENTKRLLREINQNYPHLKCTNKHHE